VLDRLRSILPAFSGPQSEITTEIKQLSDRWSDRNKAFERWDDLLHLKDQLATPNMESFVGNDPRTTYNMAVYLLQPKPFVHKILKLDGAQLSINSTPIVNLIQNHLRSLWEQIDRRDAKRGRQSWFWGLISMTVATGWYAMPYMLQPNGVPFVDYWNPATVYPEWDDDIDSGLPKLARVHGITPGSAQRMYARNNWPEPRQRFGSSVLHGQIWKKDRGEIILAQVINGQVVEDWHVLSGLVDIPVQVGRAGGLT